MYFLMLSVSTILAVAPAVLAEVYQLTDNFVGNSFLTDFDHQAIPDPTHGRGVYVDQKTALAQNLTFVTDNTVIMRADSQTVLKPEDPGRNTVRIVSKKTYTTHTVVFDVRHMPQGCGTWPAAWEVALENWPATGEVDILEGANDVAPNSLTLHTSTGCTMPAARTMTGTAKQLDCDANLPGNLGCGVSAPDKNSYGPEFNNAGGGFYVMERTPTVINAWFFSRQNNPPQALVTGGQSLDTSTLGEPTATFPNTSCDFEKHFAAHNIVINLALCGDWAGNTFTGDGCPGSCVDLVNTNPGAFKDAFWDIAAVRVYETNAPKRRSLQGGRMKRVRRAPTFWDFN